ncbi:hypothetical protein L228DRAFT_124584 [Xylona heveae TC161]|uniref:Uncharacterized protein n=1 Tax=Xylona heveae (strain CBS 132557 / TC161) TaxID=1328760 RepID=A0A165HPU3_XYLHT|nr:hypothetical protein L228DRAFT_124584 [Xylona heveae TC161]KZF23813.1 hypothetical protein L228DRAFT_124584 [Xylona heveae TC161]
MGRSAERHCYYLKSGHGVQVCFISCSLYFDSLCFLTLPYVHYSLVGHNFNSNVTIILVVKIDANSLSILTLVHMELTWMCSFSCFGLLSCW